MYSVDTCYWIGAQRLLNACTRLRSHRPGRVASRSSRRNPVAMAMRWKEFSVKKTTLIGLGLGQLLSLLNASTGFSSSVLSRKGIDAPTSQSFINYVLLALVYGGIMLYRRQALKAKWYYYVLLGLVDVEGNFLVVKAYQYTSITSIMLLDCWTIPCVLFLTWFFLKTYYRFKKFVGVGICIVGLVVVVFSDVHSADRTSGVDPIKGDLLVIAGATLYAVANVSEEFFVKSGDLVELMAFLGIFGAIISAFQIGILERHELESIHWSPEAVIPFVGFSLAMFLFYSGVPILLKRRKNARAPSWHSRHIRGRRRCCVVVRVVVGQITWNYCSFTFAV
ncbi:uncharacterized protein LOC127242688 isoform X2 [Andrographis paniculata]|uniref:uncharacterized protein LOC127242688 isoform X2 n=1 Tax=Andrographis paniculata TaxID=175694 RepID=UPI0021E7B16A|nr:uncharacterized protein LOC127242688 isoform X2 [Andrographis paniculata]